MKEKEKAEAAGQRTLADASGLDYIEVRFWRQLNFYTNAPLVSNADFQTNTTMAIDNLNNAFRTNNIPLRFYASCNSYSFKTSESNISTNDITKYDAKKVIEVSSNSSKGLDVFYFAGKIMDGNASKNFAYFPWDKRNYTVASTTLGLITSSFTHEVGHAFALYHTHENARGAFSNNRTADICFQESVSRVRRNYWYQGCASTDTFLKCEINGDQIAGTQASIEELFSYMTRTGTYNGLAGTDNWGDSWIPPVNNYMSAGNNDFRTEITPMQAARILSYGNSRKNSSYVSVAGPSILCVGTTGTYSVSVSGVTACNWTVPTGFSILSGQGINKVIVRNNSSTSGGVVEVAFKGCGAFGASKRVSPVNNGYYIIGNNYVNNDYSSNTYSVSNSNEVGITYSWTPPPNTYVGAGGTTGNSLNLIFPSHFTGGYVSVKQTSSCGTTSKNMYIQSGGSGSAYRIRSEQDSVSNLDVTVSDLDFTTPFLVYPNPSNGAITVEFLFKENYLIQIYSMDNKLQKEVISGSPKSKLDITHLTTGIYILKIIYSKRSVYSKKLIIN
ncbi:MAG: zinc-dependent metalloprotease [Bacteroidota bacterium]|nr:zinc-dependent metalloprotease [Bacteroidota bacterium]